MMKCIKRLVFNRKDELHKKCPVMFNPNAQYGLK